MTSVVMGQERRGGNKAGEAKIHTNGIKWTAGNVKKKIKRQEAKKNKYTGMWLRDEQE